MGQLYPDGPAGGTLKSWRCGSGGSRGDTGSLPTTLLPRTQCKGGSRSHSRDPWAVVSCSLHCWRSLPSAPHPPAPDPRCLFLSLCSAALEGCTPCQPCLRAGKAQPRASQEKAHPGTSPHHLKASLNSWWPLCLRFPQSRNITNTALVSVRIWSLFKASSHLKRQGTPTESGRVILIST